MHKITIILLNVEEQARKFFESYPFVHAFLAGVGVIIFWRGVWELLDRNSIGPIASIVIGSLILGSIGVFIQTFLGNTIIIKNVKQELKTEKKVLSEVEGEVESEEITLKKLAEKIDALAKKMEK